METPSPDEPLDERGRSILSLDGPWGFAPGEDSSAGAADQRLPLSFPHIVTVPGCWQAEGHSCRHAWYRRQVNVPAAWRGRHIWLVFDGVSYQCDIWVNDGYAFSHEGHFVSFEQDISPLVRFGETNEIVVRVSDYDYGGIMQSEQWGEKLIGVYGCWTTWAGIYQAVRLEARDEAWIDNLFVLPDIDQGTVTTKVRLRNAVPGPLALDVGIQVEAHPGGTRVGGRRQIRLRGSGSETVTISVPVPEPILWEPDNPALYTARATLTSGRQILDTVDDRFGMRKIEVRGKQIYLNNRPVFLRGWLCDAVYPEEISPTITEEKARRILAQCKEYGFNFVRHHTHPETPAFHRAADEDRHHAANRVCQLRLGRPPAPRSHAGDAAPNLRHLAAADRT